MAGCGNPADRSDGGPGRDGTAARAGREAGGGIAPRVRIGKIRAGFGCTIVRLRRTEPAVRSVTIPGSVGAS